MLQYVNKTAVLLKLKSNQIRPFGDSNLRPAPGYVGKLWIGYLQYHITWDFVRTAKPESLILCVTGGRRATRGPALLVPTIPGTEQEIPGTARLAR